MFQYHCLNPIAQKGLDIFDDNYKKADTLDDCQAVLVRSAKMHDMEPVSYTHLSQDQGRGRLFPVPH